MKPNGLVFAASTTSQTSMFMRSHISAARAVLIEADTDTDPDTVTDGVSDPEGST